MKNDENKKSRLENLVKNSQEVDEREYPVLVDDRKMVIKAVESNNPLDYDGKVQRAYSYLPYSDAVCDYCEDKRFSLIKYSVNGKVMGSAICYFQDRQFPVDSDRKFMVDSVEGSDDFNRGWIFGVVYEDLKRRAEKKGAAKIAFNPYIDQDSFKRTPAGFIEHIRSDFRRRNLDAEFKRITFDRDNPDKMYTEPKHFVNGSTKFTPMFIERL